MKNINEIMQDYIQKAIDDGRENGVQFVVFHKDKCIVNVNLGYSDLTKTKKITEDTMFPIFSTSKGICATICHKLADRGLFDYSDKVSKYWPGFKADVTIGQVLLMTSALYKEPKNLIASDLLDWDYMCSRMAEMEPSEEVGKTFHYHTVTFGWLAGNIACLVTGKTFPELLEDEIKKPIGISNLYIGAPSSVFKNIVPLYDDTCLNETLFVGDESTRGNGCPMFPLGLWMNTENGYATCCPAASGVGSAMDIAKVYATFVGYKTPYFGKDRLNKALKDNIFTPQWGYRAYGYHFRYLSDDKDLSKVLFGHNGYNGSFGYADTMHDLSFGFCKNYKTDRTINEEILNVFYKNYLK